MEVRANADCDTLTAVAGHGAFWWPGANLSLDLTDATGRAHAAWWLADRRLHRLDDEGRVKDVLWGPDEPDHHGPRWMLTGFEYSITFGVAWQKKHEYNVPALAALDPADPRLLPDGSRWVDAEALRLVVLHVAGVPS
jgi:hypothetical protein